MSSIFSDSALHPGRDPGDSWWITLDDPAAWQRQEPPWQADGTPPDFVHDGTRRDASRGVVELAPAPLADGPPVGEVVVAPDGTRYASDPDRHQVNRLRPCDAASAPLPCLCGFGWETGRLHRPRGLALDDRGWLYIADSGNHRVQVVDPIACRVVIVLGCSDSWGRPVAGDHPGAMREPFAVAVGARWIWIAEAERIHVYDRAFRYGRSFAPADGPIVAIAPAPGDRVDVALAGTSTIRRFSCAGAPAGELSAADAAPPVDELAGLARFAVEGTLTIGPIDGGTDGLAWHRIEADATLPPGTRIELQSYAADGPDPRHPAAPPAAPTSDQWAPALPVAIPLAGGEPGERYMRPVLSETGRWERARGAPYRRIRPTLHRFAGEGPDAASVFDLPIDAARSLRVGDGVRLRSGTAAETATIATLSDRLVSIVVDGPRVDFGLGAELVVVERDGRRIEPAPRVVYTLTGTEVIAIGSVPLGDAAYDLAFPHAAWAMIHVGDVVELRAGGPPARILIEDIDRAASQVTVAPGPLGNYEEGTLELLEPVGRFVVEPVEPWQEGWPLEDEIAIAYRDSAGEVHELDAEVYWSDPAVATIWAPPATTLPAGTEWLSLRPIEPVVATDRGRFLWIRVRLLGARAHAWDAVATATPTLRAVRAHAPRPSLLRSLPAVFARRDDDDPSGALFLERLLALHERRLSDVEERYESIARQLNPLAADEDWLRFLATWFDLAFDPTFNPTWPRERRARLVAEIFELYRRRGTVEGLRRYVEIYTGREVTIIEGFQVRPRGGMVLGCQGVVGCGTLGGLDTEAAAATGLLDAWAHRFTLIAHVDDDCDREVVEPAVRAIVESSRPAHTVFDLRVIVPDARVGVQSMVGLDLVIGGGEPGPAPLGTSTPPPKPRPAPILAVDAVLGASHPSLPPVGDLRLS